MAERKRRHYTIMFVPDDNSRTFSIRLNRAVVRSLFISVVVFAAGLIFLIVSSGRIALKLQLVNSIVGEKSRLEEENRNLLATVDKINRVRELGTYLQRLTALTNSDTSALASGSESSAAAQEMSPPQEALVGFPASVPVNDDFWEAAPNIRPVEGWITREFSADDSTSRSYHPGIDFAAAQGTPIRATAPGIVSDVQQHRFFGLMVTVSHGLGFTSRYSHCSQALVFPGQHVTRGQAIALVGNSGRSSAPHLHYEVLKDGNPIDPLRYTLSTDRGD